MCSAILSSVVGEKSGLGLFLILLLRVDGLALLTKISIEAALVTGL